MWFYGIVQYNNDVNETYCSEPEQFDTRAEAEATFRERGSDLFVQGGYETRREAIVARERAMAHLENRVSASTVALVDVVVCEASRYHEFATGPAGKLGIGHEPTPEEEQLRRALYARWATHLAGPLARKAARATTNHKRAKLIAAVDRVSSGASLELLSV